MASQLTQANTQMDNYNSSINIKAMEFFYISDKSVSCIGFLCIKYYYYDNVDASSHTPTILKQYNIVISDTCHLSRTQSSIYTENKTRSRIK